MRTSEAKRQSSLRQRMARPAMPGFIEPSHPTPRETAPKGAGWLYEIKTDGYRAQVHIRDGKVTIYTRRGHDWSREFAAIAAAARGLDVREAIIDGEAT